MYLGIDIGTSAVKALLVDDSQNIVAEQSVALSVNRPEESWSEQNPEDWWQACCMAINAVRQDHSAELHAVKAIGLSGQMHGATLLDKNNHILRPAILWNDGRSADQCATLSARVPNIADISGSLVMPGFTAPKVLWVAENEPEIFAKIKKILLPKDYVRFRLTGEYLSDMSDSAGTSWMDIATRSWSEPLIEATGLSLDHMPDLVEGTDPAGQVSDKVAASWGLARGVTVAGGGGDNACGAVAMGAISSGQALLSLGTSGVYFVANKSYSPNPKQAIHAFCHAIPRAWHQMSVILSASSCLSWVADLTGADDVESLLMEAEQSFDPYSKLIFLPYLSGERTPHNAPDARGVFFGMSHSTHRENLAQAVLEGVAFAFADGQQALLNANVAIDAVSVIGGGSRSLFWGRILSSVLDRPLLFHPQSELGPAVGAARLARLAVSGESIEAVCTPPTVTHVVEPNYNLTLRYESRFQAYQNLYRNLETSFAA